MNDAVEASYRHCARVARRAASSFYWAFWLLPRAKRRAMYALYAFSRHTDDLCDNDQPAEDRRRLLDQWRAALEQAFAGRINDPVLPALVHTVRRYGIPPDLLFEVLDGVAMDLEPRRYETFEELCQYAYRVASAVGLACIHIWGFTSDAARDPAIQCGLAFQLTNILRDLKEDLARDRLYLPLDDLRRFGVSPDELKRGVCDDRIAALVRFETDRAEQLYRQSAPLSRYLQADGRRALKTMMATYRQLLWEIRRRARHVLKGRIRLPACRKLAIALSALVGTTLRAPDWAAAPEELGPLRRTAATPQLGARSRPGP